MPSIGDITGRIVIVDKGSGALSSFTKSLETHAKRAEALGRQISNAGQALTTTLTLPLAALGAVAIKSASDFESSFAGVRKTVDATEKEFAQLQAQLRALAAGPDAIPIDINKLNAVAEAAGQLGIAKEDIVAFTRTMADLGATTNLTADEAATATAQFQNIFGAAGKDADRFGSTLVALGNAGASTERDIISMGLRIAGAGVQIGLSQGQVLAWASALSDVGIEAEAGGSAISKTMLEISLAVSKGGAELQNFSAVAGMSVAEFSKLFRDDASLAVQRFIEGLARIKESGGDTVLILDQMGITEQRMRDALNRASGSSDSLARSLKLQGEAWRDNNALTDEAKKRYETFESQLQLFLNRLKDITITFGTGLLPALLDALDAAQPWIDTLKSMVEWFAKTSPGFKTFVISIAAITAAIGPAVFITGQLLLAWSQIVIHAPGVVTALNSVALATKGIAVIGVLLFINEIIKAWGRASEAVTQYNLEVAKIEGNALAFAQRVSQGALYQVVSQAEFDQKIKEADILAGHIKRISGEVDNLNKIIKTGAGDQPYLAKQKLPEKEQELNNLWAAHNKLRSALAGVTIAGEEAEEAFNPSPFAGLAKDSDKALDVIANLTAELIRQTQALKLLRDGIPVERIENLLEAARELEKVDLFDPLVIKAADLKGGIDEITTAFEMADKAKKKFAEVGDDLDKLIAKGFERFGGNDPEIQKLIATLREARSITESIKSSEEKRLEIAGRARQLYEQGHIDLVTLQAVLLANADQWNVELDETQLKFNEIYEKLSYIAEGIALDLVSNWRRAWEENESITAATIDTLRDSFANVLQDIVSQWLSAWFKAMAAWLARWIATQRTAQIASAQTAAVSGASGAGGGVGSLLGMGSAVSGATGAGAGGGLSSNVAAYGGWALAAFGLYVVYKGFVERERKKFAQITIEGGQYKITASRGQKYLDGVSDAAESIVKNLTKFLANIDVTMTRLGTVIVESSKSGWNVSIPGSTGQLFSSMDEAISYAQVLMIKYGEFADSVSTLVQGVITSTKAISIEQLAGDLDWARMLETQNLEQAALDVSNAMDVAIANWKRAEEMFLSFYSVNLPAFEAAIDSIITKLGSDLVGIYNRLAGIEEDPEKAWQRQKAAYNAQRLLVLAQLKLWELEIAARIANYNAQARLIGGGGGGGGSGPRNGGRIQGGGGGILGMAFAMVQAAAIVSGAADVLDPALQALLDIQDLINRAINETPPELTDTDYPGKKGNKGGGGRNRRQMREDIRDELDTLEAEAQGALHSAFNDLNNNLAAFRERAKEAKLPAAELARGIELMTEAFRRSVQQQARDLAGLDTDLSRRLREIKDFFDEVRELGPDATGISSDEADSLEAQAIEKLGADLSQLILDFAGLSDPMLAINMRADELRQGITEFAEAAGWSAEQIDAAMRNIERGIDLQRQQGINSVLGNLFGMLKQFGLFQEDALEFERQSALLQLQIIEAQLRFYNALDASAQTWIDGARDFINSPAFGQGGGGLAGANDVVPVKIVQSGPDPWDDIVDTIKSLVETWQEGVESFAQSTKDLLTNDQLTNLTQAEQLEFAKSQLAELTEKAKGGDIEALSKLADARAEFLSELRESEGGGFGYEKGFEWAMEQTADVLAGAAEAQDKLIAKELAKNIEAWAYVMDKLAGQLSTDIYKTTDALIDAIYDALGKSNPFGYGVTNSIGYGMRFGTSANLTGNYDSMVSRNALSRATTLSSAYTMGGQGGTSNMAAGTSHADRIDRDTLSRLTMLERSNETIAKSLSIIKDDIGAIRRSKSGM